MSPRAAPIPKSGSPSPEPAVTSTNPPPVPSRFSNSRSTNAPLPLPPGRSVFPLTKRRSRSPSPSASKSATPAPVTSGVKRLPVAPPSLTKSTPRAPARSTNQFGGAAIEPPTPPLQAALASARQQHPQVRRDRTSSASFTGWDGNAQAAPRPTVTAGSYTRHTRGSGPDEAARRQFLLPHLAMPGGAHREARPALAERAHRGRVAEHLGERY